LEEKMNRSRSPRLWRILALAALWIALLSPLTVFAQTSEPTVLLLTARGPLTPILVDYLARNLSRAPALQASAVIIQLDTPGGNITLMESIIQDIRASQVPVIVYVSPRNAMAGSAGALITMAGHLSAMAPETTIGASSPVGSSGQDLNTTEEAKTKEITRAMVRTLTQGRSPEATQLGEDMVQNARAVTVDEALQAGLVDFKANDAADLLQQADGRTVKLTAGPVTLHTTGARILEVNYTFVEQVLQLLIDPNLVFILLAVGVQAILIELASPGGWVAGFVGVTALLLAVYGIGLLPVNWFGLLFIVLAFVLFLLDIKAPTHGALTAAGTVSFITGALVLFNSVNVPGFPRVSVPLVVATGVLFAGGFFTIITIALRARSLPVRTGREALVGKTGIVRSELNPRGMVHAAGEMWSAEDVDGQGPIPEGSRVEVVELDGLKLKVRRVKGE
jgi:membrane-bound serine protease (ClpP class)